MASIDPHGQALQWPAPYMAALLEKSAEDLRLQDVLSYVLKSAAVRQAGLARNAPSAGAEADSDAGPETAAAPAASTDASATPGDGAASVAPGAEQETGACGAGSWATMSSCHEGSCGKLLPLGQLLRCGGCRTVLYCSAACQARQWKKHKAKCKALQAKAGKTSNVGAVPQVCA